jgi:cell division protease FtsH
MVAEELFFGEHGTGPSSDLTTATSLAAQMVGSFGMGRNLISFEAVQDGAFSSSNIVGKVLATEEGRAEVEDLLRRLKSEVTEILGENRHLIQALRDELMVREELLGDEILQVLENA